MAQKKGGFNFNPSSGGSAKAPQMGGKSNTIENALTMLIAKQVMDQRNKQQTASGIGDVVGKVKEQFPQGVTPGSTLNVGENVSANIKMNRELTQDERSDLEHYSTLEKYISDMESLMEKDPNKFQQTFAKANLPGKGILALGDQDAINMNRALSDWSDRILRARSKSQTTEKEFSRIRQFAVPTLRDITVTEDPSTGETFPTIRKMFSGVKDSINRGRGMILGGALSQEYLSQPGIQQAQSQVPQQSQLTQQDDDDPLGVFK